MSYRQQKQQDNFNPESSTLFMEEINVKKPACIIPDNGQNSYSVTIGRGNIRVISIFSGTKTASELIHEAAVKKILYGGTDDETTD